MPAKKQPREKIDWENIVIEIVPIETPNPHNPYSEFTPEARLVRLQEIYQQIYARKLESLASKNTNNILVNQ